MGDKIGYLSTKRSVHDELKPGVQLVGKITLGMSFPFRLCRVPMLRAHSAFADDGDKRAEYSENIT